MGKIKIPLFARIPRLTRNLDGLTSENRHDRRKPKAQK